MGAIAILAIPIVAPMLGFDIRKLAALFAHFSFWFIAALDRFQYVLALNPTPTPTCTCTQALAGTRTLARIGAPMTEAIFDHT